jgi:hypothetical protein
VVHLSLLVLKSLQFDVKLQRCVGVEEPYHFTG